MKDNFDYARYNDVTVNRMMREGQPPEAIIVQLVKDKEHYLKRIMELESIAPRKIELPDGRVMVWQCPTEFVPRPTGAKPIPQTIKMK